MDETADAVGIEQFCLCPIESASMLIRKDFQAFVTLSITTANNTLFSN